MRRLIGIGLSAATVATVIGFSGGVAMADGGGSGTWPSAYPLPTNPGTVISQTSQTAVVRSTDEVFVVHNKLRDMYVTQLGCTEKGTVDKDLDFFCYNPATRKTDEIYFTFAALDPTATDPSLSQTNAFYVKG